MSSPSATFRASLFAVFALITLPALSATSASPEALDEARKTELDYMLRQDCGSCHGMTLKGGLGPALTADALRGKPRVYLQNTIRDGHPGTPMPPWGGLLSDQDIDYLLELLSAKGGES